MNRRPLAHVAAAVAVVAAGAALAADAGYEERLESWALKRAGLERDLRPEGKQIDEIVIVSENIVAPTDPWPGILNAVHVTTRDRVIRREILVQEGDPYSADLIEESERNLRKLFILSVARAIPVKSKTPGAVGLLVVTKDLWSIRLNTEFNTVGSLLQLLHLRPTEQNFLGLNQQFSLDLLLKLDTVSFGQAFQNRRVFGSRLAFKESAAIIVNRASGRAEGSRGNISFGQPLYSLAAESAFRIAGAWRIQKSRIYRGAEVWQLPDPDPAQTATVPFIYDDRVVEGETSYTRSFGRLFKTDVSAILGAYRRRYAAPDELALSDQQRAWLTSLYLPRSEDAVYLGTSVNVFRADYRVLRGIETFALSEDVQLGHSLLFLFRWADPAFGSPTRFLEMGASLRYRLLARDDLAMLTLAAGTRFVPGNSEGPSFVNRRIAAEMVNYSPRVGIGRFAFRGLVDLIYDDLNHRRYLLGGGNGLRGAPAEVLVGTQQVLFNLEYRTLPVEFHTLHAGAVAFWDVGSAFNDSAELSRTLTHTIGIGFRALFPQFDTQVFRFDFGYVVRGTAPSSLAERFSSSFGQVFYYRPEYLDYPLN